MDTYRFNPKLMSMNHQGHCTHPYFPGGHPARTTRWHEMDIITLGGGRDIVNGVEYTVHTGDVFYRTSGVRNHHFQPYYCYFFVYDPYYDPSHEPLYALDHLDTGVMPDENGQTWDPIPPFSFSTGPYLGKLTDIEPVFKLSNQILYQYDLKQPDELLLKSLLLQLFCELRDQLTHAPARPEKDHRYIQYATQINDLCYYITHHPDEEYSIERMASMAQLSSGFFSRVFHEIVDMTPLKYVHTVKINRIKTLLLDTTMSITEIAAHCRFEDPTYMYSLFKRYTGATPGEYRKANAPKTRAYMKR